VLVSEITARYGMPSVSGARVVVTVAAASKKVCTVSGNKTVTTLRNGRCVLKISVTSKSYSKKITVKVS
jgi:hypothetical protein